MTKGSVRKMATCQKMATSRLRLPRLVGDGMVLQRDTAVRIWGWTSPLDTVTVDFAGRTYKCTAGDDGKWEVMLEPLSAGGPYDMRISTGGPRGMRTGAGGPCRMKTGADEPYGMKTKADGIGSGDVCNEEHIELGDILIGDVWVCSGQSNMQTPVSRLTDLFGKEIEESCSNRIRYFLVPERYDFNRKHEDLEGGRWVGAEPSNVLDFSAVPLFFASALHKKYNVPIGIINASVGGSPAEAWMSGESLHSWPHHLKELEVCKDDSYVESVKKRARRRHAPNGSNS